MNPWLRLHVAMLHNPKVQRLPDRLFKTWINLLCVASAHDGALPPVSDIAFTLRLTEAEVEKRLVELEAVRLIDAEGDDRRMHDWDEHQFKSDNSTGRSRKHRDKERQRQGNVPCNGDATLQQRCAQQEGNVSATPPDTEQNRTDAESATSAPSAEANLYRRAKEILGRSSGGLTKKLLAAKGGNVALARAVLEVASQKGDAAAYVGGVIRGEAERAAKPGGWDGTIN